MRAFVAVAAAGMLAIPLAACQNANQADTGKKLDDINQRLSRIEAALKAGGGPAGARGRAPQRRQRPPGPNPATTYSVPIQGSAWEGAEHAKVTVVEGFEFA